MSIRPSAHPRLSWTIFGATCAVALGAALVASLSSGGRTNAVAATAAAAEA